MGLMPVLEEAARMIEGGVDMTTALGEVAMSGFLVGRGLPPAAAVDTVRQWRMAAARPEMSRPAGTDLTPLVRTIEKDLQDEANAAQFYTELMGLAEDPVIRDFIQHARDDERKHYRMLGDLYRELTGRTFSVAPQKVEYAGLRAGLLRALQDELEAAEEYRDTYLRYRIPQVRDLFFELMTDEMEHATRFTYALGQVR
jgi:rubrerythrin